MEKTNLPLDHFGKEIKIGDHVIYNRPKYENFGEGEIIEVWDKDKFGREYGHWFVAIRGLRNQRVTRIYNEVLVINDLLD